MTDFVLHSAEAAAERTIENRAMLVLIHVRREQVSITSQAPRDRPAPASATVPVCGRTIKAGFIAPAASRRTPATIP